MKSALAQLNYHIGNFEANVSKIINSIKKAKKDNVDLVIFSELSVCGYPPYDLLEQEDFISNCNIAVKQIAAQCSGIAAIVGANNIFPNTNVLVVDIGTAITFDVINNMNQYIGGNISPGVSIRFRGLNYYTDKLPLLKPNEKHTQDKIIEITALLAGMAKENSEYTDAISEADGLFALKNYEEAKLSYMKASNIKSKEQYPKDKIEQIEQLISNQKAIQAEYNRIIAIADRMMVSKEYDNAKEKYSEALIILPNEDYPTEKLKEIDGIILSQELALQETYNGIIAEADALFGSQKYRQSKIKYQDALKYKPNEEYPVQKIAEVERLVSDLETLQANYSRLIATADKLFKSKDYQDAKPIYVEASALFPEEEYPKSKIEEINLIFKAEMQQIQQAYDKAIADADKFFSASVFDKALDSYRNAKEIKSDEIYPGQMITSIMKILDENAVRDVVTSAITIENNSQKKFNFSSISVSDRKSSFLFIKARNVSDKEFKVVLGYGKGGSKNGGYILPIPAGQKTKEYIIPIGKQYTWFTEDNDWISMTPQGGSVEVLLIKISRGK